jgi:2-amino-4-hydroxy-6-hydroxymethyldihydropteridine diphosphokinase
MKYLFGLGSNLKDRLGYLSLAVKQLGFLEDMKVSSIYESEAMLLEDAPTEWNHNFLNLAVSGSSDLSPEALLIKCKSIENSLGRDNNPPRWSPRVIDIDILLAGNLIINNDILSIPHSEMLTRAFVLLPVCEIEPKVLHPITQKTLQEHLNELKIAKSNQATKTSLKLYG